jgi:hypothetical protein
MEQANRGQDQTKMADTKTAQTQNYRLIQSCALYRAVIMDTGFLAKQDDSGEQKK